MTELAQLPVAVYKGKQAAPQTLSLQVICQIFTSCDKFDPNVFLLLFHVKQSEDVLIINCIKMPFILFHRFPN